MNKKKTNLLRHREIITPWLTEKIQNGKCYFKSSEIAEALPVTIRQVASCLSILSDDSTQPLIITQWGTSGSTTWKITLRQDDTEENPGRDTVNQTPMHA